MPTHCRDRLPYAALRVRSALRARNISTVVCHVPIYPSQAKTLPFSKSRKGVFPEGILMLSKMLLALLLMALCVLIHSMGVLLALRWLKRHHITAPASFWQINWTLVTPRSLDDRAAFAGNHRLGLFLPQPNTACRICQCSLFQHRHLHHHRLRRSGVAARVAHGGRRGSIDRHPHVRLVYRLLFAVVTRLFTLQSQAEAAAKTQQG